MQVNANSVTCEFLTKDILIVGLKDLGLTERLFRELDLTLIKAIQVGQNAEETKRQTKELVTPDMVISFIKCKQKNRTRT